MAEHHRLMLWLTLFAVAMANVEAALVIHLRAVYYPDDPRTIFPLVDLSSRDLLIELIRETATVIMILSVAVLGTRGGMRIFAAFVFTFGLWDIGYYVWLWLLLGWPVAWLEWDVLFLIPWPWFGPWVCPVLISTLFVAWGAWVLLKRNAGVPLRFGSANAVVFVFGSALAVAAFLLPAAPRLLADEVTFNNFRPEHFSWTLFVLGYAVMAGGLWRAAFNTAPGDRGNPPHAPASA